MSSTKYDITNIVGRILLLSSYYSTDKEFLKKCDITNLVFLTDLKKGRNKNPGADILAKIVRGTKCRAAWLLLGEGEIFDEHLNLASDSEVPYTVLMDRAEDLLSSIEAKVTGSGIDELSPDIDVQLSQLLTTILQRRHEARKQ